MLSSKKTRVSVCVATYNGEKYIRDQLQSILLQLNACDEVIVSDNGSTDNTTNIVLGFGDPRISLVYCDIPGVVANFQNALMASSGEIIILSDQDDIWLAGRVDAAIADHHNYDLSVISYTVVDEGLNPAGVESINPKLNFFKNVLKNGYLGCCMSFKRQALQLFLPIPSKMPMHDWWIASCSLLLCRVHLNPAKLILYRRHSSNASSTGSSSSYSLWIRVYWRFILIYEIILRASKFKLHPRTIFGWLGMK